MSTGYLDLETYSPTPISAGSYRYAERAEVMLVAWAIDDGPIEVADLTAGEGFPRHVLHCDTIVGHNFGLFDRIVLRAALGIEVPLAKLVDTMAVALAHSLPAKLDSLCKVLKVPTDQAKDKDGKRLINLFCKPRPARDKLPRYTRETHPEDWAKFKAYAGRDIEAMRVCYRKMPRWNYPANPFERRVWTLDQHVNDRGLYIDTALVDAAIRAVDAHKQVLADQIDDATLGAVQAATQRDALLAHLLAEYDLDLPDLTASTIERRLEDESLPAPVRELLLVRLDASTTSTAKYPRIRAAINSDGRMRGTMQYCGAARTARWAHRTMQPGNLPRPTYKAPAVELGIKALKLGCLDLVDDVMAMCSSALRGTIIAPPGLHLCVADLSNIEGRKLAWLAVETWKLDAFRAYDTFKLDEHGNRIPDGRGDYARLGPDLYLITAGNVLRKPHTEVAPDERQVSGKVPELACGYQGSVGAFATMAKNFGVDIDEARALEIVRGWRAANPNIVQLWYTADDAVRRAIAEPNVELPIGEHLTVERKGAWLRMRLPSGRFLCYPQPAVAMLPCKFCKGRGFIMVERDELIGLEKADCFRCDGSGRKNTITYWGVNQYTRKWDRLTSYGGKFIENATQASSRDVLAEGLLRAEAHGFAPVLHIHDEIVAEADPHRTGNELGALMSVPPEWAPDLPLASKGFETLRYRKD